MAPRHPPADPISDRLKPETSRRFAPTAEDDDTRPEEARLGTCTVSSHHPHQILDCDLLDTIARQDARHTDVDRLLQPILDVRRRQPVHDLGGMWILLLDAYHSLLQCFCALFAITNYA